MSAPVSDDDRWYRVVVGLVGGLIGFGMLLAIGREIVPDVLDLTDRRGYQPGLVAAALLTAGAASWWSGTRFVGPWAASTAQQLWAVGGDQRSWRRRTALRGAPVVVGAAGVVAIVVGLAATDWWPVAAGGTVLALLLLTAAVGFGQRHDGGPRGVAVLVGVAHGLLTGAAWGAWAGGLIGTVAIIVGVWLAGPPTWGRYAAVARWNLAAADRRRCAAIASVILLEPGVQRRGSGSRHRIGRLPRSAAVRLAVISGRRLAPSMFVMMAPGLVVAAALADLLGPYAGVASLAVILHAITAISAKGLLAFQTQVEVRRMLLLPRRAAVAALVAPGAAATLITLAAASLVIPLSVAGATVLLVLPTFGLWSRSASAELADELTMISTPMGAVPVQTVIRLVAGVDATVIAVVILGLLPGQS